MTLPRMRLSLHHVMRGVGNPVWEGKLNLIKIMDSIFRFTNIWRAKIRSVISCTAGVFPQKCADPENAYRHQAETLHCNKLKCVKPENAYRHRTEMLYCNKLKCVKLQNAYRHQTETLHCKKLKCIKRQSGQRCVAQRTSTY